MISPLLRRNFSEIYKKLPLAELQRQVPGFNFSQYLDPILPRKLADTEDVVIYALPFYQKLVSLVEQTDRRVLSNYILWRFIRHRITPSLQITFFANIETVRGSANHASPLLLRDEDGGFGLALSWAIWSSEEMGTE